jgi:phospholipid-binding lipoprotein MlaA
LLLTLLALLAGCATKVQDPGLRLRPGEFRTPVSHAPVPDALKDKDSILYVHDPLEGFNRAMYAFNAQFDRAVFLPVVDAYEYALPQPVRTGVSNAIDNLNEVPTFANSLLQGSLTKSGRTLLRFVINSTLGVAGLLDVASDAGIRREQEDFGQTLGVWGLDQGPYLVLPVMGPSNVRDTLGSGVDMDIEERNPVRQANTLVRAVDKRARMPFRYFTAGTPFEYEFLRFLYSTKRRLDVEK